MSQFYENLSTTASDLLKKFGQEVRFTRTTNTGYVPGTGVSTSTTSFKGYGAVLKFERHEVDGKSILSTDIKLILERVKSTPQANDICSIGSVDYLVMDVDNLAPAGTSVIYTCQLRVGDEAGGLRD